MQKFKRFQLGFWGGFIILLTTSEVMACKRTPLSYQSASIQSVLEMVAKDARVQRNHGTKIKAIYFKDELTIIETVNEKQECHADAYQTFSTPDCKVTASLVRLFVKCGA